MALVGKGLVVVTVAAVAAAIAVYESPQARQFAEDVRRRIAMALHSLGDEINPASQQQPRFNRPEDAEGFMQSAGGNAEMDADEESKRRQREELMYWNAVHLEKKEKERKMNQQNTRPANRSRGSSFEDFLQEDPNAEKGTFVYNTGADVHQAEEGMTHRRGGVRGLDPSSVYANPFADEHHIDVEDSSSLSLISPDPISEKYETMSDDLYTASEPSKYIRNRESAATLVAKPEPSEMLIDTSDAVPDPPISLPVMEELVQEQNTLHHNMAGAESPFASINAWADNTTNHNSFYSPLPTTPRALSPSPIHQQAAFPPSPTFSDPPLSIPGSGDATPTDSMSMAGSAAEEVWQPRSGATSEADFMSLDGEGISTPGSWTEVGSVVSENDVGIHH